MWFVCVVLVFYKSFSWAFIINIGLFFEGGGGGGGRLNKYIK